MSIASSPTHLTLLALGLLLASCSLESVRNDSCSANSECRDAFGRGWTCEESGFCSEAEAHPRCTSYPEEVLENLGDHEDRILFGSLLDLSEYALLMRSARLAMIQVNTRDGLEGREFGSIECTNEANFQADGLDADAATEELSTYLADVVGVPTIVGPGTSTRTEIAFHTAALEHGTLLISPSATSPALTTIDGSSSTDEAPGLLWRTAPPDELQGRVLAEEMKALDLVKVGIAAQVGAYGEGLAAVFQLEFDGADTESELRLFQETGELGPIVSEFADPSYDAVLVISSSTSDIADFLNGAGTGSASEAYDDLKMIFLPDGAKKASLIEQAQAADELFDDIRGTHPSSPSGSAYNTFVASYGAVFNGEDPNDDAFSSHSYDAGWLAILGAAWADFQEGSITGLGSAKGLRKLSSGDSHELGPNSWTSIRAAFQDGESVDVSGASGYLDFDPTSGETSAPVDVWGIVPADGGGFEITNFYCVDLSESPVAGCCTQPGVDCEDEAGR